MPDYDLKEALDRIAVLASVALSDPDAVEVVTVVPRWPYWQEVLPYGMVRINNLSISMDLSAHIDIDRYTVGLLVVIGHLTEGADGEVVAKAVDFIQAIRDIFWENGGLTGQAYPGDLDYIYPAEGGARLTGIPNGTRTVDRSNAGGSQHVIEFIIDLPFLAGKSD